MSDSVFIEEDLKEDEFSIEVVDVTYLKGKFGSDDFQLRRKHVGNFLPTHHSFSREVVPCGIYQYYGDLNNAAVNVELLGKILASEGIILTNETESWIIDEMCGFALSDEYLDKDNGSGRYDVRIKFANDLEMVYRAKNNEWIVGKSQCNHHGRRYYRTLKMFQLVLQTNGVLELVKA